MTLLPDANECSRCKRNGEDCGAVVEVAVRPGGGGIFAGVDVDPPPLPMRKVDEAAEMAKQLALEAAESCRSRLSKMVI